MGQDDGQEALPHMKENEQQKERHTRNNVRVDHRNAVQETDGSALAAAQVMDADGRHRAQQGRHKGRRHGDEQGVLDRGQQGGVALHVSSEQVGIQLHGKALPVAQDLAFGKRAHGDEHQRGIEHQQQDPQIELCEEPFHQTIPPSI